MDLPELSNEEQIEIFELVKNGLSIDKAITLAHYKKMSESSIGSSPKMDRRATMDSVEIESSKSPPSNKSSRRNSIAGVLVGAVKKKVNSSLQGLDGNRKCTSCAKEIMDSKSHVARACRVCGNAYCGDCKKVHMEKTNNSKIPKKRRWLCQDPDCIARDPDAKHIQVSKPIVTPLNYNSPPKRSSSKGSISRRSSMSVVDSKGSSESEDSDDSTDAMFVKEKDVVIRPYQGSQPPPPPPKRPASKLPSQSKLEASVDAATAENLLAAVHVDDKATIQGATAENLVDVANTSAEILAQKPKRTHPKRRSFIAHQPPSTGSTSLSPTDMSPENLSHLLEPVHVDEVQPEENVAEQEEEEEVGNDGVTAFVVDDESNDDDDDDIQTTQTVRSPTKETFNLGLQENEEQDNGESDVDEDNVDVGEGDVAAEGEVDETEQYYEEEPLGVEEHEEEQFGDEFIPDGDGLQDDPIGVLEDSANPFASDNEDQQEEIDATNEDYTDDFLDDDDFPPVPSVEIPDAPQACLPPVPMPRHTEVDMYASDDSSDSVAVV